MKTLALTAATLAATMAAASPAAAAVDLTGASVTATLLFPDQTTTFAGPVTATVGAGIEFPQGAFSPALGSFDIGAKFITFFTNQSATYGTGSFNGYRLDFTGFTGSLSSLQLSPTSTFMPVSFTTSGNSVFLNVSGQTVAAGDSATLGAVPEPATWAFMILGFGAIGGAMRRRAKQSVRVTYA